MKFLILDTYYPRFQSAFVTRHPGLELLKYAEQWRTLMDQCFGTADYYSLNLRRLGHEAQEVIGNFDPLQRQWAREHGLPVRGSRGADWQWRVLAAQVSDLKPDILYVQDIGWTKSSFLREVYETVGLVVGQTAYPLDPGIDFGCYDLILTSFPHYVDLFRGLGVPADYLRIGFEPEVLKRLGTVQPSYSAVFVGGYASGHRTGSQILEYVATRAPVDFWGYGVESLASDSPIRKRFHGEAWGLDMYRVLAQSKIVLNRHIDIAGRFANNMRLYEATGAGALLVTDAKDNLHELFEPGKEVVAYRSAAECADLVRYYLEHEDERLAVSRAGHERTLREHTYYQRMQELVEICETYLQTPRRRNGRIVLAPPEQMGAGGIARSLARRLPFQPLLQSINRRLLKRTAGGFQGPVEPHVIAAQSVDHTLVDGWKDPMIPSKQRVLVDEQLRRMYQGDIVVPFRVAAEAMRATGKLDGSIIEVGCGSAYYWEVLSHLLGRRLNYLGIDYSPSLIATARQCYPGLPLLVGDAVDLPLKDGCCDVLISGGVLLHVRNYEAVIGESARAARDWCIFHRTPVVRKGPTSFLSKVAYDAQVLELVFNEREILGLFEKCGLSVEATFTLGSNRLKELAEETQMKTYVCLKKGMEGTA